MKEILFKIKDKILNKVSLTTKPSLKNHLIKLNITLKKLKEIKKTLNSKNNGAVPKRISIT